MATGIEHPASVYSSRDQTETVAGSTVRQVHHLDHDGKGGELFVIFLVNLALTVLTLGIYRFWGKTRIRQYVWSHTSLLGERLEYTGRGIELFVGFLFALVLFYAPIIAVYVWFFSAQPAPGETPTQEQLQTIIMISLIFFAVILASILLYYVALFAAYRYRISRTSWFGIRGGMEGSAWAYGFLGFGLGLLNAMTLGWTKPWADSVVFKYRLDRTWFGSRKFTSNLDAGGLYGSYAIAWVVTALIAVIGGIVFATFVFPVLKGAIDDGTASPDMFFNLQLILLGLYFIAIVAYQILICWYKAALVRNIAGKLSFENITFKADITGFEMFKLRIPNFLLMVFTLGFAYPYVVLRTARFVVRHVEFHGDIETATIGQSDIATPWYGEGLMEFLGVGMI